MFELIKILVRTISQSIFLILYLAFLVYVYWLTEKCAYKYWRTKESRSKEIKGSTIIYLVNYSPSLEKAPEKKISQKPLMPKLLLKPSSRIT